MYKILYTFLNNNDVKCKLQFGLRQQYSTSHALINTTENVRKALDDGNIGCRYCRSPDIASKIELL